MSTVDREIGPKGYDPYCHNPYALEDDLPEYWAIDVPGRAGPLLIYIPPPWRQVRVRTTCTSGPETVWMY